jgi:OB-fold nucleic acid binding domain
MGTCGTSSTNWPALGRVCPGATPDSSPSGTGRSTLEVTGRGSADVQRRLTVGGNAYEITWARLCVPASKAPVAFISDLRPSRVATIEVTVVQLEPIREADNRSGGRTKTRSGRLKDGTGEIALFLWGSEVELVQVGDRVRITDGWVEEYQGRLQISLGERGKLEKLPAESRGGGLPH